MSLDRRLNGTQQVRDFSGETRAITYQGPCMTCGRRVYAADDGDNDPRGVMGLGALYLTDEMMRPGMPPVVFCWGCMDTQHARARCWARFRVLIKRGLRERGYTVDIHETEIQWPVWGDNRLYTVNHPIGPNVNRVLSGATFDKVADLYAQAQP